MRVIVTGAAGFIGAAVCDKLLALDFSVIGVDPLDDVLYSSEVKLQRLERFARNPRFIFVNESMDHASVLQMIPDTDVVINEAAVPGLSPSWTNFKAYSAANNVALVGLLKVLAASPSVHLVHASTSSVYGANAIGGEVQATVPVSPYGVTKLAAENLIGAFRGEFGVSASILRYFSVFGPRQRPDMAYARFCSALFRRDEIHLTGDGSQTRSNTFIDDVVEATVQAALQRPDGLVANVCGGETISLLDALQVLAAELDVEPMVRFCPRPEGDQLHTRGDWSRAKRVLGWSPVTSVHDGLRRQAHQFLEDNSQ